MTIDMHRAFQFYRPDEIAECWEGVNNDLYAALWACVPHYQDQRSPEEQEEPCAERNCLADHWDRFTPEQQSELNELAVRNGPQD